MGLAARALALAQVLLAARGEVFTLKDSVLPGNRSLQVLHAFYVFGQGDVVPPPAEDPIDHAMPPYVKFEGIAPNASAAGVIGVQLSLVSPAQLQVLMQTRGLCDTALHLTNHSGSASVKFDGSPFAPIVKPLEGGIYYLVYSNCGDLAPVVALNGRVSVKSPYGYLPGDEYFKKPFYGWLAVAYVLLTVVWGSLMVRWYREVLRMHKFVLGVLCIGLVQMLTIWYTLSSINDTGDAFHSMSCFGSLLSVAKLSVSYMVLVAISSGWGVTQEDLDESVQAKLHLLSLVFVPVHYFAHSILKFKHSQRFAEPFMYGSLAALVTANALVLLWIVCRLSDTSETLKQRNLKGPLELFDKQFKVLALTGVLCLGPLTSQVMDIQQREQLSSWKEQWLYQDGASGIIFLIALVMLMFIWAPNENSSEYSFSAVATEEGSKEERAPAIWQDDEEETGLGPSTYGNRYGDE